MSRPRDARPEGVVDTSGRRYLLYASQVYALAVLRPLEEAIRRGGGQAAWFFDGPGARWLCPDERRLERVEEVLALRPAAVFVPGNRVPPFFPGAKVQLFHGFSVGKRSERRGHFRIRGLFDLYCTQGPSTTARFEALAATHGTFRVAETGWPKTDPLFRPAPGLAEPWRRDWPDDGPIVLYGSTFTSGISSAPVLRETIGRLVRTGPWNWIVTLHPKMPREIVRAYRGLAGPRLRFAETDDVVPLLLAADAMVSDTSSILHEFLLLHRPVVTFRTRAPGPQLIDVASPGELAPALARALERPAALLDAIRAFGEAIHPRRDGRSSERVLAATHEFLERGRAGLRPQPLNLVRRLAMRRRLGYWRGLFERGQV